MTIHSSIQEAIKRMDLVFFVGSGFSASIDLPNWTGLIALITEDLKKDYPDNNYIKNIVDQIREGDYTEIEALDKLKQKHYARILDIVDRNIQIDLSNKDLSRHKKIWQITDQVITTNYDKAFEEAACKKIEKVVYDDHFHIAKLVGAEQFLFKVHGCIEQPAQCVLFSDQYKKLYEQQSGASIELFRLLAGKTIIFLGFSLKDPYVNELLRLRQKAYNNLKNNNFIITTDPNDFLELGVEKIEGIKNYGAHLEQFLDELIMLREKYPPGFCLFLRAVEKENKVFTEEQVWQMYLQFINAPVKTPIENVIVTGLENEEEKLLREIETAKQTIADSKTKVAEKAFELAQLKKEQFKYSDALNYYEDAIKLHPNNPKYLLHLGILLSNLGDYQGSIDSFERSLNIIEDKQNAEVATLYNNIGLQYNYLGKYERALDLFNKSLKIDLMLFGPEHEKISIRYSNIGMAYTHLADYEKALDYHEKALKITINTLGEKDPSVSACYNNIGHVYSLQGKHEVAVKYPQMALDIDEAFYGKEHPQIAIDYNNLGSAWDKLEQHEKAIGFYEKALAIDIKYFGERHPRAANRYSNIAYAKSRLGNPDQALDDYYKALEIRQYFFSSTHHDIGILYYSIGLILGKKGESEKGIEQLKKAVEILKGSLGESHPNTLLASKAFLEALKQKGEQ